MSEEIKQNSQAVQEEEDLFGDFEVSQVQQQQQQVLVIGENNSESHGNIEILPVPQQQEQENKEQLATGVQGEEEDLFGDFEETAKNQGDDEKGKIELDNAGQDKDIVKNEEEEQADEKQQQNDILNKDLEIQQKEQQAEIQQQVHQGEEDLFGDFDTSTPAQIVEPVKQTVDIIEKKEQEQEDLFGDFNEIEQGNIPKNVEECTHQVEQLNDRQEQENQEEKVGQIDGMKQEENINEQLNIENVKKELDSAQLETNQPDLFGDFTQESKEKEVENGNKELNSHHDLQVHIDSVNDFASDKIQHVEGIRENQEKIIKNEIEDEDLFGDFNENQEIVENKKDENDINVNEKCEELKEVAQTVLENNNDEKNENNEEPLSLNGVQQEVAKSQNENVERNEGDCGDVLIAENTKKLDEKETNNQVGIQSQDDEDLFDDFKGDSKQQDNQNHKSDGKIEEIETQNTKQEEDLNVDNKKCLIDLIDQEKKDEQKEEDCPEKNGQQEVQQELFEVKTKDLDEDLFGDDFMEAKNTVESNQAQQPVEEGEHYSKEKQEETRDLLNEEENGGKLPEVVVNLVELNDNVNLVQAQDKPVEEDLFGDFANTQQKQQGEDNSQPEQKEDTQVVTNKEEKQEQDGNNIEQIKHETNDQQDQKNDVEKHEEEIEMDGYQDQGKNDFVDSETNNEVIAEIDSQNQGGTHNASQHLEDQKQQEEEEETQSNEVKKKQQGDQNGEESCKKSDQKDDKPEQQEDLFGEFKNIENQIQKKDISENDQIDDAVADEVAVKDVNQQNEEQVEEKSDQNRIVSSQQHDEPIDLFAEPYQIEKDDGIQHQQQDAVNVGDETNQGDLVSGVENNRSVPEQEDQSEFKEKQEDKNDNVEDSKDNQQKQSEEVIIEDTITQQQDHQEKNEEIQVISEEQELNNRIQDEEQKEKKIEVDTEEVKQTNQIAQSSIIAGDELIESEQNIKQEFSNNVKAEIEVNVPEQEKDEQQAEEIIQNTKVEDLFGDFNGDVNQQQGSQEDQSSINKAQTEEKIQEIKEIGAQEIPKTGEKGGNEQDDEDLFEDFAVSDNHGVDSKNIQTVHEKIEIEHLQEETVNQIIKTNNANETNDEDLFESEDKHEELVMNKQTEGQVDQVNKDNLKDEGQEGKNNDIIQQEEDKSREEEKENIEENNDNENGRKEVRENSDKQVIEEQGEVIAKEEVNIFDQIDLEKNEEIQTPKEYQNKQEKDIPLEENANEKVNGEVNEDSEYFGVVDHEEKDKQKVQSAENLFEEFEDVVIPVQQGEEKITTEKQGAKQEEIEQGQNAHQADRVSDGDDFGDFEDVQNQEQIDQVKEAEYQRKEESIEEEKIKEDDLQHVHDENLNGSDDFGEFEETPKVHNIEEIKEISKNNEEKDYEQHKTKDEEEDDEEFGDFVETPNVQTAEVAKQNQKEEEKKVQVVEDQEEDEDGFGDFEDADVDTAPKQVTAQEQQSIQKVEGTISEVAKVTEKKDTEEDEFGDFEETETKAAPVAPPVVVQKPAVSSLNYKFPSQEVDFSLSGREVDYTKYLCSKLGESISGMFGIGNSNLDYRENERSHFDGDSELWMSKKYDELALRSAGNENLKIIAELFKEKQKTIAKTFIKHEKKIIGEPMKGSQLSVLKNNSVIWRDSSSKNNLLKSLRVKEDNDKTPKVEEQEDMLPSLKNISSKVSSTAPRQSSTVEDQSEIFSNQPKNQSIEPELKQEKSVNQSGSQESKQQIQKNIVEKINNKEQIQAQQQQAEQKKKQVEEDNIQKKLAEQEELNRQLKEKQQQDLEKKKQEQSRQLEQVLKQQEIDENNKKQAQEEIKKQENKALEKQESEEDFDDFQDAEIAPSQQEEKQQPQQQQQTQIQAQNLNQQPIKNTNNLIDDDFDIFDAPPSKQSVIQTQPQKPAAQFFDLFDDTPSETLQKADGLSNNNQTNKNDNQNFINNTSEHLSLYDIQPKKQEIVDQQLPSSDNQLDPAAVQFLQSLPDLGYVLSKSLCYPQTLFS